MQRKVSNGARSQSAARLWAPLARFIDWETALGEKAEARGRAAHFVYEFVRFGVKQAWACLFGALMLAGLIGTHFFYPKGASLARYDFLVIAAVFIQILMLGFRLETIEEAKVILVFHVVGTVMEIFKTSVGSWSIRRQACCALRACRCSRDSCTRRSVPTSRAAGGCSISALRGIRRSGHSGY